MRLNIPKSSHEVQFNTLIQTGSSSSLEFYVRFAKLNTEQLSVLATVSGGASGTSSLLISKIKLTYLWYRFVSFQSETNGKNINVTNYNKNKQYWSRISTKYNYCLLWLLCYNWYITALWCSSAELTEQYSAFNELKDRTMFSITHTSKVLFIVSNWKKNLKRPIWG